MKILWDIITALAGIPYIAVTWSAVITMLMVARKGKGSARLRRVYWECRPLAGPGLFVVALDYSLQQAWWSFAIEIGLYLLYRFSVADWDKFMKDDDDDDPWKRRKAKITETIREVGGRLVTSPAPSPA